jgi:hypothetical protein
MTWCLIKSSDNFTFLLFAAPPKACRGVEVSITSAVVGREFHDLGILRLASTVYDSLSVGEVM